jgi:hypothetical protein
VNLPEKHIRQNSGFQIRTSSEHIFCGSGRIEFVKHECNGGINLESAQEKVKVILFDSDGLKLCSWDPRCKKTLRIRDESKINIGAEYVVEVYTHENQRLFVILKGGLITIKDECIKNENCC